MTAPAAGPLAGVRVVEFAGIGPGPHAAMLLADMGAGVLRIDRPGGNGWPNPVVDRGRATIVADIRTDSGRDTCLSACDAADVVVEGFRPGVMERLGLGPTVLGERNPRLVYARMTGWGQDGPRASTAGHDINYIAVTGALAAIGHPADRAVPPLNLVGDFGGGSMFLVVGILAALLERERSGRGQVVDAAIVDGVSHLMSMFSGLIPTGRLSLARERNPLGGAAPYYRTYRCADGREMAVGAIEPPFWAELLRLLAIPANEPGVSQDEKDWAATTERLERVFASRPSSEWVAVFDGSDACVAPVLTLDEAMAERRTGRRDAYVEAAGVVHPVPAPRFSRTPGSIRPVTDGAELLARWVEDGASCRGMEGPER